ncbi:Dynamin-A [Lachnellula hyalina]|uniref:Dynamin-A n=1 Tax=Lachnellula hyalina TaxID=1316788 RepID=A0A8H8TVH8_9HELO|nr:Dynamin-A [Lachnellula hyalina]TVY23382.1 Dynamin-A [Lachnellula hyalina]
MFGSQKVSSRRSRAQSVASDDESPDSQLHREMDRAEEDENFESSEEDSRPISDSNIILSEDPFGNEDSQKLFESIDKLRKCGAGQDLDIPQLVIVGKQSAGKSSLLQSLTDIPFPVGSRLCTQFAMRIVSRRTSPGSKDKIYASIESGDINPFSIRDDDSRIKDFGRLVSDFTPETFDDLIEDAKEAMGITSNGTSEDRNYSSKVLKIELSGPNRSHFGILDLPGVFNAEIGGVSRREKDGVTKMVTSYMNKPENIIICVADASGDIANENILPLARDIDSSRIVGVFTKCDKADPPVDIVNHVNNPDAIGGKRRRWYVVQNRPARAGVAYDREQEEAALFNQDPWLDIPEDQRGTAMLKKYLATLLCRRIHDAFPGMLNMITKLLDAEKLRRKGMGEPRVDHLHKQDYLVNIVEKYRTLALQALRSPTDLEDDDMKLRGLVNGDRLAFERDMKKKGHLYNFLEIEKPQKVCQHLGYLPSDKSEVDSDESDPESAHKSSDPLSNIFRQDNLSPSVSNPAQSITQNLTKQPYRPQGAAIRRRGLYTPSQSPSHPREQKPTHTKTKRNPLYDLIRAQIETDRGEELPGMVNPAILKPLVRKQTGKWQALGDEYLQRLVTMTTDVSLKILEKACMNAGTTEKTRAGLQERILTLAEDSRKEVLQKMRSLCGNQDPQNKDPLKSKPLQTNTDDFLGKVRQAQMMRFINALQRYRTSNPSSTFVSSLIKNGSALATGPESYENWAVVDENSIGSLFNEIHYAGDRRENVEDEIHDLLKAYYEIALSNFIYDVGNNITEPFLQDSSGPLLGLSTKFVLGLKAEEMDVLGGEDEGVIVVRREADDKIGRLEVAMRIARSPLGDIEV